MLSRCGCSVDFHDCQAMKMERAYRHVVHWASCQQQLLLLENRCVVECVKRGLFVWRSKSLQLETKVLISLTIIDFLSSN